MKKNLMFFALGVSTTLLMGAGISYWNEIRQENKYGVSTNPVYDFDKFIPVANRYGVSMNPVYDFDRFIPVASRYGVSMNPVYDFDRFIPVANRYALVLDGEIGDDSKKAMAVGFIHGMAVGRKKAEEDAKTKSPTPNRAWGF